MEKVSKDMLEFLPEFQKFLLERKLAPEKNIRFFAYWVSRFLEFSLKRNIKTGGKVTVDAFTAAVKILKRNGFSKREIGVYLMFGLPGQELEEVKEGVRFLKDHGVRINLTEFSPIPNTPCWRELKDRGIITDNIDPILTTNTVFSYLFSGYDPLELDKLKLDVKRYNSIYE